MAERLLWLPDALHDAGVPFTIVPGFEDRGATPSTCRGIIWHDTVTPIPPWTDDGATALLVRGRPPTVPPPLSQIGVEQSGRWVLVASGRANHNGYGLWGNATVGIEVYCGGGLAGREQPWNARQRETVAIGSAVLCAHFRLGADRCLGHKESDPDRKIDPWRTDCNAQRGVVAHLLAGGQLDRPAPPQPAYNPEDDMQPQLWHQEDKETRAALVTFGEGADRAVTAVQVLSAKRLDRGRFLRTSGYERVPVSAAQFDAMRAQAIATGGFIGLDGKPKT